jgi:simple sugar transport system permease protein
VIELIAAAVRLATPLAFAGLGELISERAGVLNVSLEGMILGSSFTAAAVSAATGSAWAGVAAGAAAGALVALVQAAFSVRLKSNQIITGLAINVLVAGIVTFVFRAKYTGHISDVAGLNAIHVPGLSSIPWFGKILFTQNTLFYVFIAALVGCWWLLARTQWGLDARAVGDNPAAADAAGVRVERTRFEAVLLCGALAGVAGASLSIGELHGFTEGMSGGRGFIAIAAVIFGAWTLTGMVTACSVFGIAEALRFELPAMGYHPPSQLLIAFPFVVALLAMNALGSRGWAKRTPMSLMRPFARGEDVAA